MGLFRFPVFYQLEVIRIAFHVYYISDPEHFRKRVGGNKPLGRGHEAPFLRHDLVVEPIVCGSVRSEVEQPECLLVLLGVCLYHFCRMVQENMVDLVADYVNDLLD